MSCFMHDETTNLKYEALKFYYKTWDTQVIMLVTCLKTCLSVSTWHQKPVSA